MGKSLESLHYFREAFPCEVILVDTGCGPEQRALAERYADKIVDFKWCNDFAAARNAGLKEASGEWFMYLDDDEWFDDPQQIVAFFVSGEYKNYKSATYTARNYKDLEGKVYGETYPSRMVRRLPETRFVGKIHEYLEPYERPKKEFTDFVHHYGYAYKSEEEKREHSRRNIEPLLQLRKEQPGEPRWMCQLAQEYFTLHEYEKMIEICQEGLAEWKRMANEISYVPSHVGGIYVYLMIAYEALKRYREEEEWLNRAFGDPNMQLEVMAPTRAFFCLLGAKLYVNLKDYQKGSEYLRSYIDYAKKLNGNRDALETGAALIVSAVFQEPMLNSTVLICMEAAIRSEDYKLAEEAFYLLDWQKEELLDQREWEQKMLDAFCSVPYHPLWVKLLQTLVSRPGGMQEMVGVFAGMEEEYRGAAPEKLPCLHRLVAELDQEHWYILCMRILWADEDLDQPSGEERVSMIRALFAELFEKYGDGFLVFPAQVRDVAERYGISVRELISGVEYAKWMRVLEKWCRTASLSEIRQWESDLDAWEQESAAGSYELYCRRIAVGCAEAALYHCAEELQEQGSAGEMPEATEPGEADRIGKIEPLLWRYADRVLALYGLYIRDHVFDEVPEALPEEAQLALKLKELQRSREQADIRKALECARRCLGICTGMAGVLDVYARLLRDEVESRNREADAARSELQDLIAALKRAARTQIERGEYQAARDILLQIKQCAPGDRDVEALLEQTKAGSGEA